MAAAPAAAAAAAAAAVDAVVVVVVADWQLRWFLTGCRHRQSRLPLQQRQALWQYGNWARHEHDHGRNEQSRKRREQWLSRTGAHVRPGHRRDPAGLGWMVDSYQHDTRRQRRSADRAGVAGRDGTANGGGTGDRFMASGR